MNVIRTAFAALALALFGTAWAGPLPEGQESAPGFQSFDLPAGQSGTFEVAFDATPLADKIDVFTGFSADAPKVANDVAVMVRFNEKGSIDVRNGGVFAAEQAVPYGANKTYRIRMMINVATRKYSVFVTPPGQPEVQLAGNYAFRGQQSAGQSLKKIVLAGFTTPFGFTGPHRVSGFTLKTM